MVYKLSRNECHLISSTLFGDEQGYQCVQLLSCAEPDLDFSALAQRLHPDWQLERFSHAAGGFVELVRRFASRLGVGVACSVISGEIFAHEFLGPSDGESLGF